MRRWKIWILAGATAATVGLLLFSTGAGAATRKAVPRLWGGGGGACRTLMSDPDALKAMQALRGEHRQEMQAWWQKYGDDPSSAAAQKALRELRQEHWNDMQQLFKKFGITVPEGASRGEYGPGMMGGGGVGGAGGCGGAAGGCWRNGAPTPGAPPSSGSSNGGTSYGPGMMGGAYGGMMGQSL
jgi:hypothetical protein